MIGEKIDDMKKEMSGMEKLRNDIVVNRDAIDDILVDVRTIYKELVSCFGDEDAQEVASNKEKESESENNFDILNEINRNSRVMLEEIQKKIIIIAREVTLKN